MFREHSEIKFSDLMVSKTLDKYLENSLNVCITKKFLLFLFLHKKLCFASTFINNNFITSWESYQNV